LSKTKDPGKIFQNNWAESCKKEKVLCHRFRDIFIPPEFRTKIKTPKNPYDFIVFSNHYEFPVELKSVADNKVSFSESIIRPHQIDALIEANKYKSDGVIPGFIFNFRTYNNETWFVHIEDFIEYKQIAEAGVKLEKYPKINKRSMPIETVRAIGLKINNYKMKINYHYCIREFVQYAIEKYGSKFHS